MATDFEAKEDPDDSSPSSNSAPQKNGEKLVSKPIKALPSRKMSSANQFNVLRAFGISSTHELNPVNIGSVAEVVGVHQNSISICNPFFIETGLITKSGHQFTPAKEVVEYSDRLQWEDQNAGLKLQPVIKKSWFAQLLLPRLQMRNMSENDVVSALAEASRSGPPYRSQLAMLIDYMELAGLVKKEGDVITLVQNGIPSNEKSNQQKEDQNKNNGHGDRDVNNENYISFRIPIPDKEYATISVPKGLEVEDWTMLKIMIDAYIKRMKKEAVSKGDADD